MDDRLDRIKKTLEAIAEIHQRQSAMMTVLTEKMIAFDERQERVEARHERIERRLRDLVDRLIRDPGFKHLEKWVSDREEGAQP